VVGGAEPEVIKLEPQFKRRVWGGKRLAERFEIVTDDPIGEAWMVFDENRIIDGPYTGRTLAEVLPELGEEFLGRESVARYGYRLPLMAKFLDTADWLSIQVHPDDTYARAHESDTGWLGKAEAWVVLDAEPGAQVVYGVKQPVEREELLAAARDGSILELLNFMPVRKGDVIYVPPGTIHALGPGLLIYEVSQRSDLTYRLYDYGRDRELHLEKALSVAQTKPAKIKRLRLHPGLFLDTPHFALSLQSTEEIGAPNSSMLALIHAERGEHSLVLRAGKKTRVNNGPWYTIAMP